MENDNYMYPRTHYEMTELDLQKILDACKPTPMIMLNIPGLHRSPQDQANDAWEELGKRMGFDHMTVRPVDGKGNRFFTAVPSETEAQRLERERTEKEGERRKEIESLDLKIAELTERRAKYLGDAK